MRMRFLSTGLLLITGCGGGSTAAFSSDASTGGSGGTSAATGGAPSAGGMLTGTGGSSAGGVTSGTGGNASGGAAAAGAAGTTGGNGGSAGAGGGGAGGSGAGGTTTTGGTGNAGASGASTGGAGKGGTSGAGGTTGMGGKGGAGGTMGSAGKAGTGGKASTGGASGAGGANSGPPPTVEQLVPLAVGNVWNYRTTILPGTTGTSPCPAGMHATTITGMATFQGENAFTATHFCAPSVTRYYVENAKGLEVNVGTGWSIVLPRPISDGAVFMAASSQQVLAHVADVTVPAGTFSNCWATQYLTATGAMATYCAGVGLVTLEYDAPSGGGYLVELTSYQLK